MNPLLIGWFWYAVFFTPRVPRALFDRSKVKDTE